MKFSSCTRHTVLPLADESRQSATFRADGITRRATLLPILLAAGLRLAGANPGLQGLPMKKANDMSDPRVMAYQLYLSAWSAIADDERAKRLHGSLSENIVFTNPMQTRRGLAEVIEHLRAFQQRSPGGSFRMNEMLGWESHGIATWQFVSAAGEPGFWGYDVVAFDAQSRIDNILLFSHIEKQILK